MSAARPAPALSPSGALAALGGRSRSASGAVALARSRSGARSLSLVRSAASAAGPLALAPLGALALGPAASGSGLVVGGGAARGLGPNREHKEGDMPKQTGGKAAETAALVARVAELEAALAAALAPKPRVADRVGSCECGCGAVVRGRAHFQMGHDAKLKSALVARALVGDSDAEAELAARSWAGFLTAARERKAAKEAAKAASAAKRAAEQIAKDAEAEARADALAKAAVVS